MPISPSDIYSDFQQLLANSSNDPMDIFQPPPPSPRSVNGDHKLVEGQILSAISSADIQSDFRQILVQNEIDSKTPTKPPPNKHSLDEFAKWLRSQKLTAISIKNYVSDLRQLSLWLQKNHTHPSICDLSSEICRLYTSSLTSPRTTINRKIASLRKFSVFMHQTTSNQDWGQKLIPIPEDPIENLLKNFRSHLTRKRRKSKTITNYLSDVRHYLNWATRYPNKLGS